MDKQDQKVRRDRLLSNVRWAAVFAITFVLFYRAFGPDADRGMPGGQEAQRAFPPVPAAQSFANSSAQHLVALGHALIERPMERLYVAHEIEELTDAPALLGDDPGVYLSLRAAYWQLRRDPLASGSYDAAMILWDAAERIEMQHQISAASRALEETSSTP